MLSWLIDNKGDLWPAAAYEFPQKLGLSHCPLEKRAVFAVLNLGFISIRELSRGMAVQWRPTSVDRRSVASAVVYFRDQPEQRVCLASFDSTWSTRLLPTAIQAADAMLALFATARNTSEAYFNATPRPRGSLPKGSNLHRVIEGCAAANFECDPLTLWNVLSPTTVGRYVVLRPDEEHHKLHVLAHGGGYRLARAWTRSARGSNFEDQPDAAYARVVSQAMWTAHKSRLPLVEDVQASMWTPSRGRVLFSYTRAILPMLVNGERCILSTSDYSTFG
jgi:hypothetical protein